MRTAQAVRARYFLNIHCTSQREPRVAPFDLRGGRRLRQLPPSSHLVAGQQACAPGAALRYGQSITDACIDMESTADVLEELARSVRDMRGARAAKH
jgi:hypothetical protein